MKWAHVAATVSLCIFGKDFYYRYKSHVALHVHVDSAGLNLCIKKKGIYDCYFQCHIVCSFTQLQHRDDPICSDFGSIS